MEWRVGTPPLRRAASLNMARLKKATPHALTSAAINTPQKNMKSQPSCEDRAASVC